jgi:hypothetical protein
MRNKTRNTPNRIFAIPAAAPAILEKPRRAATNAMIRKKTDQDNMCVSFLVIHINYISPRKGYQFMIFLNPE